MIKNTTFPLDFDGHALGSKYSSENLHSKEKPSKHNLDGKITQDMWENNPIAEIEFRKSYRILWLRD